MTILARTMKWCLYPRHLFSVKNLTLRVGTKAATIRVGTKAACYYQSGYESCYYQSGYESCYYQSGYDSEEHEGRTPSCKSYKRPLDDHDAYVP